MKEGEGPQGCVAAVRYYSLARYAFLDALRMMGITTGQRVLLPSFICRDLLAPITIAGAKPCWYAVDHRLQAIDSPALWPHADVVLAVNFFGFPQDLSPFYSYVARTGACLIEDNAHGYLGRDEQGQWLGTRAPLGLSSLRKTIRLPDGAALLVNDPALVSRAPGPLPMKGKGLYPAQLTKARLRKLPLVGDTVLGCLTRLARGIRYLRTGSRLPLPCPRAETDLEFSAHPYGQLQERLSLVDISAEIARRRKAWQQCMEVANRCGVVPLWVSLPDGCAPYGFAFRGGGDGLRAMQGVADRFGFDLISWPDLPAETRAEAPDYYFNVYLVNFLW